LFMLMFFYKSDVRYQSPHLYLIFDFHGFSRRLGLMNLAVG
jgi:hypothetical protein